MSVIIAHYKIPGTSVVPFYILILLVFQERSQISNVLLFHDDIDIFVRPGLLA